MQRIRSSRWGAVLGAAAGVVMASAVGAQESFRVASYNIRASAGSRNVEVFGKEIPHFPSRPRRNLKRIARVLEDADVDVVALQEVQGRTIRSWGQDQAKVIAKRLGMEQAMGVGRKRLGGVLDANGNALLGDALHDTRKVVLTDDDFDGSPRLAMIGWVEPAPGVGVWAVSTHLSAYEGAEARLAQLRELERALEELEGPVVLMGDLNAEPESRELAEILDGFAGRRFQDAGSASGAPTYPARGPERRIDYVLVSEEFEVVSAEVPDAGAGLSDHLPVVAELRLRGGPVVTNAAVCVAEDRDRPSSGGLLGLDLPGFSGLGLR